VERTIGGLPRLQIVRTLRRSKRESTDSRKEVRGSSALHAAEGYLLLTRPSPQFNTVELRFQSRYAAPQPPRLLRLFSAALWLSASNKR